MLSSFKGRQHFFALLIGVSIKKLTVLFPWSSNKIYILKQFLTINKICKKKNTKKENIVVLSKLSFFIKHNAHGEGDFFKKSNRTFAFLVLLQLFFKHCKAVAECRRLPPGSRLCTDCGLRNFWPSGGDPPHRTWYCTRSTLPTTSTLQDDIEQTLQQ